MQETGLIGIDLQYIKGVGPKRALLLKRLGIVSLADAIYYLPFRYEDRRNLKAIRDLSYGGFESVAGNVMASEVISSPRQKIKIFELTIRDDTGVFRAKWFNQPFMQKNFHIGDYVILSGVVKAGMDCYEMHNPDFEVIFGHSDDELIHTSRVVPIYKTTSGLSARLLRTMMFHMINTAIPLIEDPVPQEILYRYGMVSLVESIRNVHFPDEETDYREVCSDNGRYRMRLAFDELLYLELGLITLKSRKEVIDGISFISDGRLRNELLSRLPFRLTGAQNRALKDIYSDMARPHPMNRLLQGDVGCGKTIVAALAMLYAIEAGYQAALMAPTEILAQQHYINICRLMEGMGVGICLLTGKRSGYTMDGEITDIKKAVHDGLIDLVIGTHALIQGSVGFNRLGLVVIDEQHRFGVMQRATLRKKGVNPDVLVMTATPIPRTLALTLYGDLDYSVIDELPPNRRPVWTKIYYEVNKHRVYEEIRAELDRGGQVYVVYPLIEESETLDLHSAVKGREGLSAMFRDVDVGLIHGKMKVAEKEGLMEEFRCGSVRILVSTTVIEVGIDVPNASLMVIIHAERFGLSQLHQLRGRVGRGKRPSRCILLAYYPMSDEGMERLRAMEKTTDGFKIAEADLKLRGPGEFLGTKQSGLPDLKVADIVRDAELLEAAHKEAAAIIASDPGLIGYRLLREGLNHFWHGKIEIYKTG